MKTWIICSGPDWYRPSVTSTKHLIWQFKSDGYHVLWINPIAFKSPFLNSSNKSSAVSKIKNKLWTHLHWLQREFPGFWVISPIYFPVFREGFERLNNRFIRFQIKLCCHLLNIDIHHAILWISGSFTAESLLDWPFYRKVYQAADLISSFRGANTDLKNKLEAKERNLCVKADTVFGASENIAEKLKILTESQKKVHLLHHGVDFDHFASPVEPVSTVCKITSLGKPLAGYFGSLSDANDKDVFIALANVGFSVVIIGKILGDYQALYNYRNIHFLGPVPYIQLPAYAKAFNVGILNWRMHEWIQNCFPVKALEYLALGLPVVSCKIPVLMKHFPTEISFVETPEDFASEARRLVETDTETNREKRCESVRLWSWKSRYEYVKHAMGI